MIKNPKFVIGSLLVVLFCCVGICANRAAAQRSSSGLSFDTGLIFLPEIKKQGAWGYETWRPTSTAFFLAAGWNTYFRAYEWSKEKSVGLLVYPMLGFCAANTSGGTGDEFYSSLVAQVPVLLHFSQGLLSTNESNAERGWGFSAGYEASGMFDVEYLISSISGNSLRPKPYWLRPMVGISYRYWNKAGAATELSLFYSNQREDYGLGPKDKSLIRLNWSSYMNY